MLALVHPCSHCNVVLPTVLGAEQTTPRVLCLVCPGQWPHTLEAPGHQRAICRAGQTSRLSGLPELRPCPRLPLRDAGRHSPPGQSAEGWPNGLLFTLPASGSMQKAGLCSVSKEPMFWSAKDQRKTELEDVWFLTYTKKLRTVSLT